MKLKEEAETVKEIWQKVFCSGLGLPLLHHYVYISKLFVHRFSKTSYVNWERDKSTILSDKPKAGVHKSRAPGRPYDYVLYGDA
jgi:hypothetical protein